MTSCAASVLDKPTRPAKLFNFLFHGGFGIFYFYQPLLLTRRGLPSSLTGAVLSVRPIVGIFITPLWSAAADYFGIHRSLLIFGLVVGSSSRILFRLVPTSSFWMLATSAISESLSYAIIPLGDAVVFLGLARLGRPREEYPLQRLWGAVAAGTMLPLAGALLTANAREAAWTIVLGLSIGTLCLNALVVPSLCSMGRSAATTSGSTASCSTGTQSSAAASQLDEASGASVSTVGLSRQRKKSSVRLALCELRITPRGVARTGLLFACGAFHATTEGFLFMYL